MRCISALLLGGLLLFSGCSDAPQPPNLLFIAVDTLRADRAHDPRLMPRIAELSRTGLVFEQAFSHAPWTLPSFATMFTGQLPPQHGAGGVANQYFGLRSEITTVAERLRDSGYATAAIVNVDFLGPDFGVCQGFDELDAQFTLSNRTLRDARGTSDAAIAWLEQRETGPFALFVHYFDPHADYTPPEPYRSQHADPRDLAPTAAPLGTREQIVAWKTGREPLTPELAQRASRLYDGEIAYTDSEIGRLVDRLRRQGLLENTLVVFTSDHGEEFLEHGGFEHGHSLYDELVHVPLMLHWPARIQPGRRGDAVGHVQLARTICELLAVTPATSFAAPGLLEHDQTTPSAGHGLLYGYGNFWGAPWESIRNDQHKWLGIPVKGAPAREELYDWRLDPREQRNLLPTQSADAQPLRQAVQNLHERATREQWRSGPPARLDPATLQRLENTGYVGEEPR
jgi:arylsulfatase A-like enzyme